MTATRPIPSIGNLGANLIRRSTRREIRNPVLTLPAIRELQGMPAQIRETVVLVLADLAEDSSSRAWHAWRQHKVPMAAYWKAVSVYARHAARALSTSSLARAQHHPVSGADARNIPKY